MYVAKRVSYEGNLCTVRWVGQIANKSGTWLGVEWDDPNRGKHNGEYEGVRYFDCLSKRSNPASFVRPSRPCDTPLSFSDAVRQKYASESNEQARMQKAIRISGKEAEEIGFEKIRTQLANLSELRILILDSSCIERPRSFDRDASDLCPKATELDLSNNLFEHWTNVLDISRQLPNLKELKANGNRFGHISGAARKNVVSNAESEISTLSVDETLLSWNQVTILAEDFSMLETLSANGNEYKSLSNHFLSHRITTLSLERNDFAALDDLVPLLSLVNLKRLGLKGNSIASVQDDRAGTGNSSSRNLSIENQQRFISNVKFPLSLTDVDLSHNAIASWQFIDSLSAAFPGMTTLRVSYNPLFHDLITPDGKLLTADDGYMLTLARLGLLTQLNFSRITLEERLNAEAYYLSQISLELSLAAPERSAAICARHARYGELCDIYGKPIIKRNVESAINPNSMAARLITATIKLGEGIAESVMNTKRKDDRFDNLSMEIPQGYTVYNALGIIGKRLGLIPASLRLVLETNEELPTSRDESEPNDGNDNMSEGARYQEEDLDPPTRALRTWIDGDIAVFRVEWNKEAISQRATTKRCMEELIAAKAMGRSEVH